MDNFKNTNRNNLENVETDNKDLKAKEPVLTKGMAMSFGFKRRVSSAPVKKNQNTYTNLDNSSYSYNTTTVDRNANKYGTETSKIFKLIRQNDTTKRNTEENRKISRPNTTKATNNKTSSLPKKKNEKIVRFSSNLDLKNSNATFSTIGQKPKVLNNNNYSTTGKFTLSASNLPKPQIPVHVTNLKSTKMILNNTTKQEKNDPKELITATIYNVEVNNTMVLPKQNSFNNKFDLLAKKFENNAEYHSLPHTFSNRNESPLKNSKYRQYEGKSEPKIPHNSPQKVNYSQVYSDLKNINNKYEKSNLIMNVRQATFVKEEEINNDMKIREINWENAGETMADDASCSFSSSEEKDDIAINVVPPKSLNLTMRDPAFAAVAKSTDAVGNLLEDESPADSLFCSISDDNGKIETVKKKTLKIKKEDNEKEKSSPTTPTNGSNNSLSLSEGKDFLIDDEIADQPALLCNQSVDSPRKSNDLTKETKIPKRTSSLDTLSPCDSITSDDLMLNFDNLDTSEFEDTEKELSSSTRFSKSNRNSNKILNFSPNNSPIKHARINELKHQESPKKITNLRDLANVEPTNGEIICSEDILQDITSVKNTLLRLRGVLLEYDLPPIIDDGSSSQDLNYVPKYTEEIHNYKTENMDLKRQVIYLQGELEDKERALLNLKKSKKESPKPPAIINPNCESVKSNNAATQTEKERSLMTASRSFNFPHHKDEFGTIISIEKKLDFFNVRI